MTTKEIYLKVTAIKQNITWQYTKMKANQQMHSRLKEFHMNFPLKETPDSLRRLDALDISIFHAEKGLKIKLKELKTFLNECTEI